MKPLKMMSLWWEPYITGQTSSIRYFSISTQIKDLDGVCENDFVIKQKDKVAAQISSIGVITRFSVNLHMTKGWGLTPRKIS